MVDLAMVFEAVLGLVDLLLEVGGTKLKPDNRSHQKADGHPLTYNVNANERGI